MNTQKMENYSILFTSVDRMLERKIPKLNLYFQLGKLLDRQPETGAVALVAKYVAEQYPDLRGFSPRSLRRMRAFYRTYRKQPSALIKAMRLGWTQNIVIFEANLTAAEREWYINAAQRFGWSKLELMRKIATEAHLNPAEQESAASDIPDTNITKNQRQPDATSGKCANCRIGCKMLEVFVSALQLLIGMADSPHVQKLILHQVNTNSS